MFILLIVIFLVCQTKSSSDTYGTSDLTYGTMPKSCVESMIRHSNILESHVVIDLGSGIGNVCYYFSPFVSKCIGYEVDEIRYKISNKLYSENDLRLYAFRRYMRDTEMESIDAATPENVEFYHKDFLKLPTYDADVLIGHSTTWSDETLSSVYSKALNSRRVSILISQKPVPGVRPINKIGCNFNWQGPSSFINYTMKVYDVKGTIVDDL